MPPNTEGSRTLITTRVMPHARVDVTPYAFMHAKSKAYYWRPVATITKTCTGSV